MTANIRHSAENRGFMTPEWLVDMGRSIVGEYDTDPCTDEFANLVVRARTIHTGRTDADNGLFHPWYGTGLLNMPGGLVDECGRTVIRARTIKGVRYPGCTETGECGLPPGHAHQGIESSAAFWWHYLMNEWRNQRATHWITVGFSLELLQSAQVFNGPQPLDFASCIPKQRIKFDSFKDGRRVQGDQPTHSNIVSLVTQNDAMAERFLQTFSSIGYVREPKGFYR